jgi:predicted acylesterase/phospholipase RssA
MTSFKFKTGSTPNLSFSLSKRLLLLALTIGVLCTVGPCHAFKQSLEGLVRQHDATRHHDLRSNSPTEVHNLALSGGGVYGVAHIGAKSILEQHSNVKIKSIAGTSIGALYGSLFSAGYTAAQLAAAVAPTFPDDRNATIVGQTMINLFGMKDGSVLQPGIDTLLYYKTGIFGVTFAQLASITGVQFTAVAYNLNKRELAYFNNETTPNMKVSLGVQLSSSIPVLYSSAVYNGHHYIDGGVRAVNPAKFFENDKKHTLLVSFEPHYDATVIDNVEDYASQLLLVMQENNLPNLSNQPWAKRTITAVMPAGIRDTANTVSLAQAQAMYAAGANATTNFFATPSCPFC